MSLSLRGSRYYLPDFSSYGHAQIKNANMVERFSKRKKEKTVISKGIDFLQSILNMIVKGIPNSLQDFPLFKND